jgi:glycerophosphoryl diester phosphodiesterase
MKIFPKLEAYLRQGLDYLYARWPQSAPSKDRLQRCKIISHRGEYDNQRIFENTLAAFDRVKDQGVWGIEFDVRWTNDLHPVIIHDTDLGRLFGSNRMICQATLAEVKSDCSLIPTLAEMIQRYGKQIHLMIEVKEELHEDPVRQNQILKDLFSPLKPQEDYHLLAMTPKIFNLIEFAPKSTFLPVARFNLSQISKLALEQDYAGLAGHYFLLTASRLQSHQERQQKVGTGYVNSKNCLFRELNRDVEWVFSDNAVELQKVVNRLLSQPLNGKP